ncbi:MAG: hypothetical protein GY803_21145 [Chloroflexi bacterium]|nr:hypothetical protein [Chloroflexota bacterium]
MKVEIVSISSELLMGDILDTNTAYVSRSLREMNAQLTCKVVVGNDLEMIVDAIQAGLQRADVVLAIGGLGDSANDYTRLAAAQATGLNLTPRSPGIEGAQQLGGTDARLNGFLIEVENGTLICLPGRRREMGYLLDTEALPYLKQQIPVADSKLGWVLLRTVGVMESSLKQRFADLALDARHRVTYDSFAGQTNVQLWVEAESQEQIECELDAMKRLVLERLGDHVYGEGEARLEDVALQSLVESRRTLALSECYTEQILSRMMTKTPGADGIVRSLPVKTWMELNEAIQMDDLTPENDLTRWCRVAAERLRRQEETDLGLFVYKNVTQGGVQLLVTLASHTGVSVTQRSFGGHPENINHWAATLGLSHLRRWLLAHQ